MDYHIYVYYRLDGTPYYVGKGKDKWRWTAKTTHNIHVPPKERVKIYHNNLTNEEACAIERNLISFWGRKDNNTGILRNLTDGGEGAPGRIPTEAQRQKQSSKMKGRTPPPKTPEGIKQLSKSMLGNQNTLGKSWVRHNYKIYCRDLNKSWGSYRMCYEDIGVSKNTLYNAISRGKPIFGMTFEKVWT